MSGFRHGGNAFGSTAAWFPVRLKLDRLGKHRNAKSCLYINKLADIDLNVLEEIVLDGIAYMKTRYDVFDE